MRLLRPHRRYNPLLDEWVLCSPQRLERPWQGQAEPVADAPPPAHDPGCPLCPGNLRAGGARNPAYAGSFVFDNDFPALLPDPDGPPETVPGEEDELLRATPQRGICRVICYTPRHDLDLALLGPGAIREVVDCWAEETQRLGALDGIGHVQVFENKGLAMGCSHPHPHGQIWASGQVPSLPSRILAAERRYVLSHGSDLLGDYLAREERAAERIVCANDDWLALVPFWAVWPFETLLLPRRRVAELPALEPGQRDALADMLRRLGARFDNLFRCSFPYSMGWQAPPSDGAAHPYHRLHAVFLPPLLRSASVRKFLVGYELTGEPQRDLTPEAAAARLRESSERHHRSA